MLVQLVPSYIQRGHDIHTGDVLPDSAVVLGRAEHEAATSHLAAGYQNSDAGGVESVRGGDGYVGGGGRSVPPRQTKRARGGVQREEGGISAR